MVKVGCVETQFALTMLADTPTRMIRAEAEQVRWLAALAADPDPYRDGTSEQGKGWIVEDVACALKVPSASAAGKLHVAAQLTRRLPAAIAAGHLELRSASKLVELAEALPDRVLPTLEKAALEGVESRTHAQFCVRLRKLVLQADPRTADEQHQTRCEQRRFTFTPLDHGMVELWALLPADRAVALQAELNRRADLSKGDGRTADQRRADALCDLFDGTRGGPQIHVTVPISTLLGDSDQPGNLAGHGPISPGLTRALAHDPTGTWRHAASPDLTVVVTQPRSTRAPPLPSPELERRVAASRPADAPPPAANSTTSPPGRKAAPPHRPTSSHSAADTTTSNTTAVGTPSDYPTAPSAGPAPPEPSTTDPHPTR